MQTKKNGTLRYQNLRQRPPKARPPIQSPERSLSVPSGAGPSSANPDQNHPPKPAINTTGVRIEMIGNNNQIQSGDRRAFMGLSLAAALKPCHGNVRKTSFPPSRVRIVQLVAVEAKLNRLNSEASPPSGNVKRSSDSDFGYACPLGIADNCSQISEVSASCAEWSAAFSAARQVIAAGMPIQIKSKSEPNQTLDFSKCALIGVRRQRSRTVGATGAGSEATKHLA